MRSSRLLGTLSEQTDRKYIFVAKKFLLFFISSELLWLNLFPHADEISEASATVNCGNIVAKGEISHNENKFCNNIFHVFTKMFLMSSAADLLYVGNI